MKIIYFLVLLNFALADHNCSGVYFDDKYYDIEIIKEGINKLHDLAVNNNDNIIYFIYEKLSQVPTKVLGYVNIETKEAGRIDGIKNASAIAVDQSNNRVFVGGKEGVYIIKNKVPEDIHLYENINSLFYKNNELYYTNRWRSAYKYKNGENFELNELRNIQLDKLVLDDDYNIFYKDYQKLYRVKIGTRAINSHEKYTIDFLTTDLNGKVYIGVNDGIYMYNKYRYEYEKKSSMAGLKALTFTTNGEPILCIADLIIKLKYNPIPCEH